MTSEPLIAASYLQASKQGEQVESKNVSLKPERVDVARTMQAVKQVEQMEAKSISMKPEGINIASHMGAVKQAAPDLPLVADKFSTSIKRLLSVIGSVELTMQEKRRQIEAIKARQEDLAREYRRLGTSLEAASFDLAQQVNRVISDLGANVEDSKPLADSNKD